MRAGRMLAAAATVIALAATGCGVEGGPALDIVATDFAFEGVPRTIQGGPTTVTFRNEGEVGHELAFVDIGDATFEDFRREFPAVTEGGPLPDFFRSAAVPFDLLPGEELTSTFTLPEGEYLLFCALEGDPSRPPGPGEEEATGRPHYELGMYVPEVSVNGGGGELSAPDGEIVARDYSFEVPETGAGDREFVFRNEGPKQWHHMVAFEFQPGVTEEQARAAFMAFGQAEETGQPPPPGTPEPGEAGYAGIFSPGGGQTVRLPLKLNHTYLLACFIQDLEGGPPHAIAHGMIETFTVR